MSEINISHSLQCKICSHNKFYVGVSENNELVFTCASCDVTILVVKDWPATNISLSEDKDIDAKDLN